MRSDLRPSQLRRIFVKSRVHGDHVRAVGLLASLGLSGSSNGVDLYGPDPLDNYLQGVEHQLHADRLPLAVHRVREAAETDRIVFEDDDSVCVRRRFTIGYWPMRTASTRTASWSVRWDSPWNIPPARSTPP